MGIAPAAAGCGFTINLDDLTISNVPGPAITEPLLVSPNTLDQGTFVPGLLITSDEPIFGDPEAFLSMGAGVTLDNVEILDPFTVIADARVSQRALLDGHSITFETATLKRMSAYQVEGPEDPVGNTLTTLVMTLPPTIVAGTPFDVRLEFDDIDGDYVEVFAAIKDLTAHAITARGLRQVFDTSFSDPLPEIQIVTMPPLSVGSYALIGIVDDGIGVTFEQKLYFEVGAGVPSVSPWGLVVMAVASLTIGGFAIGRRRAIG